MSEYSLDHFAEKLAEQRDEHQAAYDEHGSQTDDGYARAFRLALSFLRIHTGGDYGQSLEEQAAAGTEAQR